MTFPFNYFLAAFAGAFLTTLLALPLWRRWCLRIKLVDDPGQRKIHDQPVPLAGGPMPGLSVDTGLPGLFHASLAHIYPDDRGMVVESYLSRIKGGASRP